MREKRIEIIVARLAALKGAIDDQAELHFGGGMEDDLSVSELLRRIDSGLGDFSETSREKWKQRYDILNEMLQQNYLLRYHVKEMEKELANLR